MDRKSHRIHKEAVELRNELSQVAAYRINIDKSIVSIHQELIIQEGNEQFHFHSIQKNKILNKFNEGHEKFVLAKAVEHC